PQLPLALAADGLWGHRSGYIADADAGYESRIVEEVPEVAALVDDRLNARAPRFIAGLSMGGFGALRLGAKYAARFGGISAHSAVTTLARLRESIAEPLADLDSFGTPHGTALHWLEPHPARLAPPRFDSGTGRGPLALDP